MINLRLAELRKKKGITQQELADVLDVSDKTISRWENGVILPDVTMLPIISQYFNVSVDALLGLRPLSDDYKRSAAGTKEHWGKLLDYLKRTRKTMWNEDYFSFLIEKVWKIKNPVTILDCGCGYGAMGLFLLPLLPKGSKYTGIDFSEALVEEARKVYENTEYEAEFILSDMMDYNSTKKYDVVVCQAVLRHIDHAERFLRKMAEFIKPGGLIISIEVNREFEADGLYIDGMDYAYLCSHEGFSSMWDKELEMQNRDYSVAMKIPHYMKKVGFVNVDCRLNDRVTFIEPEQENYSQVLADLMIANGWSGKRTNKETEDLIADLMSRGMKRWEAVKYCRQQNDITQYLEQNVEDVSLIKITGLMISYGWKAE